MKEVPRIKLSLREFGRRAKDDLLDLRTQFFNDYGNISSYTIKGLTTYYMYHPDYIRYILQDNQDNYLYRHPILIKVFGAVTRTGFAFTNDMHTWRHDRAIAVSTQDPEVHFTDYANTIVECCNKMFDAWKITNKENSYIDIANEIDLMIIAINARTLITHIKLDPEHTEHLITETVHYMKEKLLTLPFLWPFTLARRRYNQFVASSRELVGALVTARMRDPVKFNDLIGIFLHDYQNVSSEEQHKRVTDVSITLFVVSYITTMGILHWVLVELSRHPEIEKRITEEVDRVIGNRNPTYQDLSALPYLRMFIKEIFRLDTSGIAIMRQSIEDDSVAGYLIPKRTGITISPWHVHRHPEFWDNPEAFDPERFASNPLGQAHSHAYIPFGGGNRGCIGAGFSMMEAMLFTIMVVKRCRLSLPPFTTVKPLLTSIITMRPNANIMKLNFKN